jgi:DNA-binding MarR family transcriptional regulator
MLKDAKHPCHDAGCNATALRKASRRLSQLYDSALEQCGLRSTQLAILVDLNNRTEEPPTLAELAEALVIERSALGHTLRPLEREGWVVLQQGKDRRQRHVIITPKGKTKCKEGLRLWATAQDRFEEIYGRSEAAALRRTLLGIAHHERLTTLKG